MAEERLPRPTPDPPVSSPAAGKISVVIAGRLKVTSSDRRVVITRKEQ